MRRDISIMRMIQLTLGYSEAHINTVFEIISTIPLKLRVGVEKSGLNTYIYDNANYSSVINQIFQAKNFPMHRQMTP